MSVRSLTPSSRRAFLARLDPLTVLRLMNDNRDTPAALFQYQTLYKQLRDANLQDLGEPTMSVAALIDQIDDACLEDAFRDAGFVVGFEVCRHLLLGEISVDALTQDEDESEDDAPEGGAQ
jgi:hypothetical protein